MAPIGDALAHDLQEVLSYLRGARLPAEGWDAAGPALGRLRLALRAGDVAQVLSARDELLGVGPRRRAPMSMAPQSGRPPGGDGSASGPRPIPEHVNKLIHGIWSDLSGSVPHGPAPGGAGDTT